MAILAAAVPFTKIANNQALFSAGNEKNLVTRTSKLPLSPQKLPTSPFKIKRIYALVRPADVDYR
jgi:hypothetical protein